MIENHLLNEAIQYANKLEIQLVERRDEIHFQRKIILDLEHELREIRQVVMKDKAQPENMCSAQPQAYDKHGNKFYNEPSDLHTYKESK